MEPLDLLHVIAVCSGAAVIVLWGISTKLSRMIRHQRKANEHLLKMADGQPPPIPESHQ